MTSRTPLVRRSATALVAGTFLLLTACGSSGGSDGAKADTSTTAAKSTTTADGGTTTTGAAKGGPTAEQLEAILPAAEELGEGWTVDDSEKGDALPIETATEKACPDAAALLAPAEDGEPTVGFIGPNQETVRVTLSPDVTAIDPAQVDAAVNSINGCDPVTAEDEGLTYTASFNAQELSDYGDGGIQIAAAVNISDGNTNYDVTKYRLVFTVGETGVVITGGDGLTDDGTVARLDLDGLDALATEMAKRAGEL